MTEVSLVVCDELLEEVSNYTSTEVGFCCIITRFLSVASVLISIPTGLAGSSNGITLKSTILRSRAQCLAFRVVVAITENM